MGMVGRWTGTGFRLDRTIPGVILLALFLGVALAACSSTSDPSPLDRNFTFAFPVRNRADIKGLVAFGAYGAENPHNGIDFRPYDRLERMEILSPVSGTVKAVREVEFGGLRHVQVNISVGSGWETALVFEPMTLDGDLFERQLAAVTAKAGEHISVGDPVGALLLGGTDGPPTVHFLATHGDAFVCPYDHSTAEARADYDFVAASGPENHLPGSRICVVAEIPN